MGSAGEAHTQAIHVVSGQTFHWRQPAFANYYLLSWQTSSFSLSIYPFLFHLQEKAFTVHTYGTLSAPFGLIIFWCDSSPCFSIKLLMKAVINKAWVHRTDTACMRVRKRRKTWPLCQSERMMLGTPRWFHEQHCLPLSFLVLLYIFSPFFCHSPRTTAACFHAKQHKDMKKKKENVHADCSWTVRAQQAGLKQMLGIRENRCFLLNWTMRCLTSHFQFTCLS